MKEKVNTLLSWFFLLFISSAAYAQADSAILIRGRIVDSENQPLPYTTVYLTSPLAPTVLVRGTSANDRGEFVLQAAKKSMYFLHATFVGYKSHTRMVQTDSAEVAVGEIMLQEGVQKLASVTVRPPLEITADKIIYRFENDPARATSSLFDLIDNMPLVTINERGKVIVGDESKKYIVLRKGREDALFNFQNVTFEELIKRLPAMGFTTFEIWTVIPPKYQDYDYVINILPDPNQRLFGVVGSPNFSYDFKQGALQTGLGGNGSADIFRFSGGVKYGYTDAPQGLRETTTHFYATEETPESLFGQSVKEQANTEVWQTNLQASLDISKQQFITFRLDASFRESENNRLTTTERTAGESLLYRSLSRYATPYQSDTWSAGATYQYNFRKPSRTLGLSYLYSSAPSQRQDLRQTDYTEGTGENEKSSTDDQVRSNTHRMQLDYYDSFLNNKLNFNAQVGYLMMDYTSEGITRNELTGVEDTDKYTRFEQDFHRIDGLVNFSYNASKRLNINAQMTLDYLPAYNTGKSVAGTFSETIQQKELLLNAITHFTYRFRIAEPKKETKPYSQMTPEERSAYHAKLMMRGISAQYADDSVYMATLPNSSIQFYHHNRQRRPGVTQLTNYVDEQDPLYIRRGNPGLRPESYHDLSVNFTSWFVTSLMTTFSFSNNMIVQQQRKEGDRILQSFYNAGKTRNFRVNIFQNLPKRMTVSAGFNHSYINYGDGNRSRQNMLSIKVRRSFQLPIYKPIGFSIDLAYRKPFNSGATGEEALFPLELSIPFYCTPIIGGQMVFIDLHFNNILQWDRHTRSYVDMPDYRQVTETSRRGLPIFFSIRTTLGKFKVKPPRKARATAGVTGFSTDPE